MTFTLLAVWVVISLAWYLVEDRGPNRPKGATQLAVATISFYSALLVSQLYTLFNMRWVMEGHGKVDDMSPYWPLAAVAAIGAFSGVAWKVWLYRPRAPTWLWFCVIVLSGVIVVAGRLLLF